MANFASTLEGLKKQSYISIETYRKSGEGVRTPVWFVESGGLLFFLTRADSGKIERLRRNDQVKVAPCKMNGEITGNWFSAAASFVESEETMKTLKSLFDEKYGAVMRITTVFSRLQRKKRVFVKVLPAQN